MPKFHLTSWKAIDAIEAYPNARKCLKAKDLHKMEAIASKYEKTMLYHYKRYEYDKVRKIWRRLKGLKLQHLCVWDWTDILSQGESRS